MITWDIIAKSFGVLLLALFTYILIDFKTATEKRFERIEHEKANKELVDLRL